MVALLIATVVVFAALLVASRMAARPALVATTGPVSGVDDVLVGRFIERSQRFRRSGAIVGLVVMLTVLVGLDAVDSRGIDLNLLVFASIGLAGSIGGSILAEGFRVRHRGPRTASLEVRDPASYRDATADRREQILLVLAGAAVLGAWVTGQHLARAVGLAAVVVVLALVRHWAVRRVALRPRPVVPAAVAAADDHVRRLATSVGISRPMTTLAALIVSAQWASVPTEAVDPSWLVGGASLVAAIGSVVLFVVAVRWWWVNRSFGLAPQERAVVGGSRSHLARWILGCTIAVVAMMALVVLARSTS